MENKIQNKDYNISEKEHLFLDDSYERVVFHLKGKNGDDIHLPMLNVIQCLMLAIKDGDLPKLPRSWVHEIDCIYNTGYSQDEDLWYHDYGGKK